MGLLVCGLEKGLRMTNKEAFEIVLKLAKANTLAEHDIMYAQQEAQASLERQAIEIVEAIWTTMKTLERIK